MATEAEFQAAVARSRSHISKRPSNADLLAMYALFKQATEGDVSGPKPGRLDLKGRAKYDAWTSRKGTSTEAARAQYVALVDRLAG
jgi:acyl-CoA-binding protein